MFSSPLPRLVLPRRFAAADPIQLARGSAANGRAALFQRFDLRTRHLRRSVIPRSVTVLKLDNLEESLRAHLPHSTDHAPLLVYASVEAVCGGHSVLTPSWLAYRLDRYLDIDTEDAWACGYAPEEVEELVEALDAQLRRRRPAPTRSEARTSEWCQDADAARHGEQVLQLQHGLRTHGLHGAALSVGLRRETRADPFDIYAACVAANPSPYGYVLQEGDFALLGSSPLAFVQLHGGRVHLETDAGTRPVTRDAATDDAAEADLRINPKDAAEHQVVVDAEVQAMAPLAATGVQAVVSREVRRFSHVMHLYSAFEADLAAGLDVVDAISGLAPAAAVSGHPKRAALALAHAVEQVERGPYGGILGLISSPRDADFAVVIRSMWIQRGTAQLRVGGKVVADSDPAAEYREAISKSTFLVNALARAESHS